jgi:hypothetical protein
VRGRLRRQATCATIAVALSVLAGGCGGSGHRQAAPGAAALVAETFGAQPPARSGRVALSLTLAAGTGEAFALHAAGPFRVGPSGSSASSASAASFALAVSLRWRAAGRPARAVAMTLIAGPRALTLRVGRRRLRLPAGASSALQAGYAGQQSPGAAAGALAPLGLHPESWLVRPQLAGSSGSAGAAGERLTGTLALAPFLAELSRLAALSSSLQGLAGGGGEASVVASALMAAATRARGSGRVELDTGTRDHLLRALSANAALTSPPLSRGQAGSREGAGRALSISFSLSFSGLGEAQRIPAP